MVILSYSIPHPPLPHLYSQKPGTEHSVLRRERRENRSAHPAAIPGSCQVQPREIRRNGVRTFSIFFDQTRKWHGREQPTSLTLAALELFLASLPITLSFSKRNIFIIQESLLAP